MRDYTGVWHPAEDFRNDSMSVQFYVKPIIDKKASAEDPDGRIIWKDAAYARLRSSADTKSEWDIPVKEEHKFRFRTAWEAFQRGAHEEIVGTPLSEWTEITRSMALNLNQLGFMSVEDVGSVPDDNLPTLGQEGRFLRDRARSFLEPKDRSSVEMERTIQAQQVEIDNLKAQLEQVLNMPAAPSVEDAAGQADEPRQKRKYTRRTEKVAA